ncbi:O-methyltransferase [Myroides phaeus]|uniref:Predicted O-methyltransferase YrrM n=1 Tax=Myroides phaeus TaxID=702745 RepID=A0A1G8C7R9_9FLAO|nr:O-methyltransferase [Myroides phaeus]MEC4115437.1 O-methyltransferase [Myroides phaeus]SDH41435.1 Predicted O-methyltransferase YrrM [Myroides phaeus]
MHFISPQLEKYAADHTENEPVLLANLDKETHRKVLQPRMLSGHFQGRFLSIVTKLINPKHILEIGTFTGYATLCLAEGLQEGGTIDTIDIKEELIDFQRKHFDASPYGAQIHQHLGSALDIIPTLDKKFDLVFIDADKPNYSNYFHLIIDKMNKGGVILSDNVLWSGKVLEEIQENDKSTVEIDKYNKLLKDDPRIETILLPIRDGLTISRVK